MDYGYFDDANKEYVITRPDTPAPWVNYLGSPAYGAIISNQAGGYSFVQSGARGRILRYRFNEEDRPGRYIYLRDDEDGDFWTVSWQPVGKGEGYDTVCRHGLGYSAFDTGYREIRSQTTYYVPLDGQYEVWMCRLRNDSADKRRISVFGYAEFSNDPDYEQDTVNLQYSQFTSRTAYAANKIIQTLNANSGAVSHRFFALAGAPVATYSGDRQQFLGAYRSYGGPISVSRGSCDDTLNYNLNSCGALHSKVELAPGEETLLVFLLGEADEAVSESLRLAYLSDPGRTDRELRELKTFWSQRLSAFQVTTPDPHFNSMINIWTAYQCYITFTWSRAASFIYCGHRDGYGYRDTVQDIQGIIHLAPELARRQLEFMLSAQVRRGAGLPLVRYTHRPGHENTPDDEAYRQATGHPSYRADDALWLFPVIDKYINETGRLAWLDQVIPYADREAATVYDHLKQAIAFTLANTGANGLPAGLHADWNDCLRLGGRGESTFVAMQLYLAFRIMEGFAKGKADSHYAIWLAQRRNDLGQAIGRTCFEDDRYIRGITERGLAIGSAASQDASFWLNPQSWSVLSGLAGPETGRRVLDKVRRELNTPWGARLMAPPFRSPSFPGALASVYNESTKENGGIFLQPQGWLIQAEAALGRGDRAYEYYRESCPAHHNQSADIRRIEPYAYGQFTEGPDSPNAGRSHVHWLTGTPATVMTACVEGILGIRPDPTGLRLTPALPHDWDRVTIEKVFRGKKLVITIENRSGGEACQGVLYLNGVRLEENRIPQERLEMINQVLCIIE